VILLWKRVWGLLHRRHHYTQLIGWDGGLANFFAWAGLPILASWVAGIRVCTITYGPLTAWSWSHSQLQHSWLGRVQSRWTAGSPCVLSSLTNFKYNLNITLLKEIVIKDIKIPLVVLWHLPWARYGLSISPKGFICWNLVHGKWWNFEEVASDGRWLDHQGHCPGRGLNIFYETPVTFQERGLS
jgi:hypothetical protein